jgi:hypothetical protein
VKKKGRPRLSSEEKEKRLREKESVLQRKAAAKDKRKKEEFLRNQKRIQ